MLPDMVSISNIFCFLFQRIRVVPSANSWNAAKTGSVFGVMGGCGLWLTLGGHRLGNVYVDWLVGGVESSDVGGDLEDVRVVNMESSGEVVRFYRNGGKLTNQSKST